MTVKGQLKKLLMYLHQIGPTNRMNFIMALDQGPLCHYCQCILNFDGPSSKNKSYATKDHIIPKSKGGTHDPENIVIACQKCNHLKANKSYEEFKKQMAAA